MVDEKTLQVKCIDYAKKHAIISHKVESRSSRGWPDVLFLLPTGVVLFIEFKHPNGKGRLSELQKRTIDRIKDNKGNAYVIDNFDNFRALISDALNW